MRIVAIEPVYIETSTGNVITAICDVEVIAGLTLSGVHLVTYPNGNKMVFVSRTSKGHRHVTLDRSLSSRWAGIISDHLQLPPG